MTSALALAVVLLTTPLVATADGTTNNNAAATTTPIASPLLTGAATTPDQLNNAKLLIKQGKAAQAIPVLVAGHARDPANSAITIALAQAYAFSGDRGQAIALLDEVIAAQPADAAARAALGQTYALNGDFSAAEGQYRVALSNDPADAEAEDGLAHAYALEGRSRDARGLYDAVLARHPDDVAALAGRADLSAIAGDLTAARSGYRRALRVDPTDVQTMDALARVELQLGDYAAASSLVAGALDASPRDAEALDLQSALRARLAPALDSAASQTLGNGIVQSNLSFEPRFFVDPRLQLGAFASRYELSRNAALTDADRIGLSAIYSDNAADTVSVRIARSQFTGLNPTIDSAASIAGARHGVNYRFGFDSGGIDLAAGAAENLIAPLGAVIRVDRFIGAIGADVGPFAVDAHGTIAGYSDTNRYRELSLQLDRRLPLGDSASVTLSAAGRAAAFSENYSAYHSHGYYDYTAQSDVTLSALAAARLGAHSDAGVLALVGQRHTILLLGNSGPQPFTRFEPYLNYDAGPFRLSASGAVTRYGTVPWVPSYYSSAVRLDVRLRV